LLLKQTHPLVLIASDGIPFVGGKAHPRGAGTFCRFLGQYVRQRGLLGWAEALRKCTHGPAQRLEGFCPAMRKKGRIGTGMDADVTVFDLATVADRATLAEPSLTSAGIAYVLVNGVFVVDEGVETGALPGRAVRGESRLASAREERRWKVPKTTALFASLLQGQQALAFCKASTADAIVREAEACAKAPRSRGDGVM
jgi:N-acyl-D-aspartate/D-glutamate deacylase